MTASVEDIATARKWASFFRMRGFNPLPSRTDAKRPLVKFAQWWDEATPADLFEKHATSNVQVMTGRRWRLLVIDLDGEEAKEKFATMGQCPRTWMTHSGGGGVHLWFSIPADYPRPLPKAFLWKGEDKHSAIERLCDKSLVMAPPSIHPTTGERYRFSSPHCSPVKLPMPATCPSWILAAKPIDLMPRLEYIAPVPSDRPRIVPAGRWDRKEVLAAISDKVAVAKSWGVRIAGNQQPNGFVPCHAIGREDKVASAGIHAETGTYVEPGAALRLSLFDLGVAMGHFRDFPDAINTLGANYVG